MIGLKPRLYFGIVKNSVDRYIQIDLKYKFLLFSDVVWLMLDIVAFTFLGGMVDAAVEPNEYYQNFTVVEASDHSYVEIYLYDSFANDYNGDEKFEHYIYDTGSLKEWEEWEQAGRNSSAMPEGPVWIDDTPIREFFVNTTTMDFYKDGVFNIPKATLDNGTHFMEIRFTDVKRTGIKNEDREKKTFSSTFFVGENFVDAESRELFANVVEFGKEGDVRLSLTNGSSFFNASDEGQGILKYSLDGDKESIINLSTGDKNVRLLPDNTIRIKDLERIDGAIDKGEHTITFKYTTTEGITFIGKHSFLVATDEWQNNDLGIDYSLKKFFLIGVLFWAFFAKSYEDTVNTIPDEAARGTIGFLITNHVNLSTLLVSRYVSSSIKTFVIAMIFVFPIIAAPDIGNLIGFENDNTVFGGFDPGDFPTIMLIILVMWLFMLVFSLLISSLNIMFKRILPFAMMMVTGLKVLTGYYFPLEALETQLELLGGVAEYIKEIPLVNGVYLIREIIVGKDVDVWGRMNSMLFWTFVLTIFTMVVYKVLERKSRKWGTLEFY